MPRLGQLAALMLLAAKAHAMDDVVFGPPVVGATIDCRLKLVVMELGDREYSTTSDVVSGENVWLCSPPDADLEDIDDETSVLYGDELNELSESEHPGQVVRLQDGLAVRAANATELTASTRHAFGGERMARAARFVEFLGAIPGHGRRLDGRAGGAGFIDRTRAHGSRSVLSIIVDVAVGGGTRATWPKSCAASAVRELMWGTPQGTVINVDASPWAVTSKCRSTDSCLYSIADFWRHTSRGAANFEQPKSRELELGTVNGWPSDFCNWGAIWTVLKNAVRSRGLSVDSYDNVVAYVPKHCAIAVGSMAGKFVIANYCPKSGTRETAPGIVAHELGHNLGFGHSGTPSGGPYDDASSVMGASKPGTSMTVNMAHRHMFHWLPGLPASMLTDTDVNAPKVDQTRLVKLADANRETLPSGAKWGIEVHDGTRSWYVSYRGCVAYDSEAPDGWCGAVQVSYRDEGEVKVLHLTFLKGAGQQVTFGSSNHITVKTPSAIPSSLPTSGTVTVSLRVVRGSGSMPPALPSPLPSPLPPRFCRRVTDMRLCRSERACRWKRWRGKCAPKPR